MSRVALLTTSPLPHPDFEIEGLAAALTARGLDPFIVNWDELDPTDSTVDLAVIRSTWDYFARLPEFTAFLDALTIPLVNPPSIVRANWHKGYLLELASRGVPVVPTALVPAGSNPTTVPGEWAEVIIKPAVSAGAIGVGRFAASDPAALAHLRSITTGTDALVQPFLPDVTGGEVSLIHLGGGFSHAVIKVPGAGDFRVQEEHGGTVAVHQPTEAELAVAEKALAAIAEPLVYARVDLVNTGTGPLVMELELIEPELFLPTAPESTDRLADAIAGHLSS